MRKLRPFTSGLPVSKRGRRLLVSVTACCAAIACDRRTPVEADPRPSASSITVDIRQINDSTIAYDLVVADTALMTRLISAVEGSDTETQLYVSDHVMPLFRGIADTARFSPRFNLRRSDTLRSRPLNGYWQWAVVVDDTIGHVLYRAGRYYSGSTQFTLAVAGLPATMQQIGLDLVVAPRGPYPVRSLRAYVDSGSASEQSFGPLSVDSAKLASGGINTDFRLWIPGPLANGTHALVFAATDSARRTASFRQTVLVDVPTRAYTLTVIAAPGAIDTYANGINNYGVIAGSYRLADSSTHAIRWSNGVVQVLPGSGWSSASVINDAGVVAGFAGRRPGTSGTGVPEDSMVVWRDTVRTGLAPGYGYRDAIRIASDGTVLVQLATVFRAGAATPMPMYQASDMNDAGVVVGYAFGDVDPPTLAVGAGPAQFRVPTPYGVAPTYPHCCSSSARWINNAGQIIGVSAAWFMADGKTAFWLVNPLGLGGVAGRSSTNLVLGRLTDGSIVVWTIGGPTTRVSFDAAGWTIDALKGINDRAQIIAHGVNAATGQKAALLLNPM